MRKRGNKLGFWFFKAFLCLLGLPGAYGLLHIVCIYYVIFDRSAVSAALPYVKRRFPNHGFIKRYVHIYRLFISQGKQLIDRYAMISKVKMFDIQVSGHDQFMNIIHNSQKGVILLTSHFGNWQIAMATLSKLNKTVYLLMRPEDNLAVQDSLQITRDHANIKVISIKQDLGGVIEIMNLLKEGQIVSIMGDRSYGSRTVEVSFLGAKAWFPYGAFTIAAAIGSPMVVLLSAKEASYQHVVDVSNILYPCYNGKQNKQQQLRQWVQDFAALLETYVARYPYQCFLFHDIWRKGTGEPIQEDGNVRSQEMKHQ